MAIQINIIKNKFKIVGLGYLKIYIKNILNRKFYNNLQMYGEGIKIFLLFVFQNRFN